LLCCSGRPPHRHSFRYEKNPQISFTFPWLIKQKLFWILESLTREYNNCRWGLLIEQRHKKRWEFYPGRFVSPHWRCHAPESNFLKLYFHSDESVRVEIH
jgi:hypothetical protein